MYVSGNKENRLYAKICVLEGSEKGNVLDIQLLLICQLNKSALFKYTSWTTHSCKHTHIIVCMKCVHLMCVGAVYVWCTDIERKFIVQDYVCIRRGAEKFSTLFHFPKSDQMKKNIRIWWRREASFFKRAENFSAPLRMHTHTRRMFIKWWSLFINTETTTKHREYNNTVG